MARRVADREEDGLVLAPRLLEGLVAPWIPVHGVMRMELQVRALLADQTIGVVTEGRRRLVCASRENRAHSDGEAKGDDHLVRVFHEILRLIKCRTQARQFYCPTNSR